MNILVTGSGGFVGRNLVENLKNIRDGKNRTRPTLTIQNIYEYDRENSLADLDRYCASVDFVFNLAGVNRPKNLEEFKAGNSGFAITLLNTLKRHNNRAPVMLSSSIQATLAGRYGTSEYGLSKKASEDLFFQYSSDTDAKILVYRFPNLVGKWVRPNYNSAVGTFCNNIANDLPITVNDPSVELDMLFIDDLIEEMYNALEGHEHHCEYPKIGEVVDGIIYDGLTPRWTEDGKYCGCQVTHKATLGRIVELLNQFHDVPENITMPYIPDGSFEKKLYSMYLSYLPEDAVTFPLKMNCDDRGFFTELMHMPGYGQVSVNISKPGITKGQHWHNSKWEFFIVVKGSAMIQERKIGTDEVLEFRVDGKKIEAVHMLPGYTHNILNLSDTDDLITIMYANEVFDPNHPDTFHEDV